VAKGYIQENISLLSVMICIAPAACGLLLFSAQDARSAEALARVNTSENESKFGNYTASWYILTGNFSKSKALMPCLELQV